MYHTLTDTSTYHVLAIDYRGFGKSTGMPSEAGLINDGVAAVEWAMNVAKVPSERIVIMGQSLGTAVTSAVAEHFAMQNTEFAGVILVAGFTNLPTLLAGYTAGGIVPVLSPFRPVPPLLHFVQRFIVDKWKSADRLATVVGLARTRLRLTIIHAKDDAEIPCSESDGLFRSAASSLIGTDLDEEDFAEWKKERTIVRADGTFVVVAKGERNIVIREELVPYGGRTKVLGIVSCQSANNLRSQQCNVVFARVSGRHEIVRSRFLSRSVSACDLCTAPELDRRAAQIAEM